MRFGVLTVIIMKIYVFCDVKQCSLVARYIVTSYQTALRHIAEDSNGQEAFWFDLLKSNQNKHDISSVWFSTLWCSNVRMIEY